jgi:hypothetical protein
MCDGGVRGKNQDPELPLGWKTGAHLGCFQWWRLLICLMTAPRMENRSSPGLLPMVEAADLSHDQEGKEWGSSLFILREGRVIGFGRG